VGSAVAPVLSALSLERIESLQLCPSEIQKILIHLWEPISKLVHLSRCTPLVSLLLGRSWLALPGPVAHGADGERKGCGERGRGRNQWWWVWGAGARERLVVVGMGSGGEGESSGGRGGGRGERGGS